ncbi:alpha/beta-hydrolase, partial [Zopfia rhizophila CBS 207.26]
RPTIVLVPGAFHPSTIYDKVSENLRQTGYQRINAISLPSVGNVLASRQPDIDAVRNVVGKELGLGNDVVLVGHSYGGTVIGEAVNGVKQNSNKRSSSPPASQARPRDSDRVGRVLGLVYLAGYIPLISEVEHPETKPDIRNVAPLWFRFDDKAEKVYWDSDMKNFPPEQTFYNDLPAEQARFWASKLQFSSYAALNASATYIPYTGSFDCTYVLGLRDQTLPPQWAQAFIDQPGAEFRVEELDASHSAMLSKPKEVANIIRKAAGE